LTHQYNRQYDDVFLVVILTVWLLNVLIDHATLTLGIQELAMEAASPNGMRSRSVELHISEDLNVQVHL
jgi:hypothetical protein